MSRTVTLGRLCAALTVVWLMVAMAVGAAATGRSVATVGSMGISSSVYRHWERIARHSSPHGSQRALRRQTMAVLLSSYWVEGEAAEKGVSVSASEVDARYRSERDANFHNTGEFKRFLRSMGETVSDLKFRVRTELLTERLRSKIAVPDFVAKWRARTFCLPAYMVSDCGGTLHA